MLISQILPQNASLLAVTEAEYWSINKFFGNLRIQGQKLLTGTVGDIGKPYKSNCFLSCLMFFSCSLYCTHSNSSTFCNKVPCSTVIHAHYCTAQ